MAAMTNLESGDRLAALDAALARGLADVDNGRVKPSSEAFDRLEAKLVTKKDRAKQVDDRQTVEVGRTKG